MADPIVIKAGEATEEQLGTLTTEQLSEFEEKGEITLAEPESPDGGVKGKEKEEEVTGEPLTPEQRIDALSKELEGLKKADAHKTKGLIREIVNLRKKIRGEKETGGVDNLFVHADGTPIADDEFLTAEDARRIVAGAGAQPQKQAEADRLAVISESVEVARMNHEDYDQAFAAFNEAVAKNPKLLNDVLENEDPGEATYQAGKKILAGAIPGNGDNKPPVTPKRPTTIHGSPASGKSFSPEAIQRKLDDWGKLTKAERNEILAHLNKD